MFIDARAEYNTLKQSQAVLREKLAAAQARLAERDRTLQRLREDPKFVEKQIREKLHYARPEEMIFRFPE
jgi:cell division protein FtsB